MNATLEKIKHLATLRERVVDTQKRLLVPIKEFEEVGNSEMAKMLTKSIKKTLAALENDLKNIEKQMLDTLATDEILKQVNSFCNNQ